MIVLNQILCWPNLLVIVHHPSVEDSYALHEHYLTQGFVFETSELTCPFRDDIETWTYTWAATFDESHNASREIVSPIYLVTPLEVKEIT